MILTLTHWIILASIAVIGGIDIVLAAWRGRDATISVAITNASQKFPFIPFLFGVLMGHFFFTYGVC
jgi:hypothetical protein